MSEVGSINPNTPVTEVQTSTSGNGKVELSGGESPLTFDELEQITAKEKRSKAQPKVDKDDEAKESKTPRSKDLSSDDKRSEAKDSKDSEDKASEKQSKSKDDQQAAELKQLRKTIKAKLEDKEFDLDEESLVPVKINGKDEFVPVKELLGNYSGKVAWDKRFTEVAKKEKSNATQEIRLRQAAEQVKSIFSEEDQDTRMYKLAQLAGVDPVTYRNNFMQNNINLLEKWYSMSEDERKADALAYEAKYHKHRADTLEGSVKQEQSHKELSVKLDKLRASHQVSEDEFVNQYDQISSLVQSGDLDKSEVTPEFIIETIQKDRLWSAFENAAQNLNLPWTPEQKGSKILEFVEDAHRLKINPEEVASMVDQIWGHGKSQKKVQQVSDQRREFLSGKKDVTQMKPKTEAPLFFDEIL